MNKKKLTVKKANEIVKKSPFNWNTILHIKNMDNPKNGKKK